MSIETKISTFIPSQFPATFREDGPNFVAFTKAYYEWLESNNQTLYHGRRLYDYMDVDTTADQFVRYFKNKYMANLPENMAVDKRLMIKHIKDLYRSKGTLRSYELLFRILFNEDVTVYIPGDDLFTTSNNTWIKPQYIEVSTKPYLNHLVGKTISTADNRARAIVETYATKQVDGKLINLLILSSVEGVFNYGSRIICDDLYVDNFGNVLNGFEYRDLSEDRRNDFELAFTIEGAPVVMGSLSAIGITNGGSGHRVGDLLTVQGAGEGGIVRVAAVRDENGRVTFELVDGGSGFSLNAQISVIGGGGSGATFTIGGLVDTEVYTINSDIIGDYLSTQFDAASSGFALGITGVTGTFQAGETVTMSTANVVPLDVDYVVANNMANGEYLSNTSLALANIHAFRVDGSYILTIGADTASPNLISGVVLDSNVSSSRITVNTVLPMRQVMASGNVVTVNSSIIEVNAANGYFVPYMTITGQTSGATARLTTNTRKTNWNFPAVALPDVDNLDTPINQLLTIYDQEVGTISFLSNINPGFGYSANPEVDILQADIYGLRIPDGKGGFKGYNATVNATAGTATGVVLAVDMFDSGYGYEPGQSVGLRSSNTLNRTVVSGTAVVDQQGTGQGHFKNRSGFLSDTQYLQDSYYWQPFSYDIQAERVLETYEQFVRELVHPSGVALFGSLILRGQVETEGAQPEAFFLDADDITSLLGTEDEIPMSTEDGAPIQSE